MVNADKAQPSDSTVMQWPIELLRGIAALMVVFAHYWGLAGVKAGLFVYFITGVDLFFVISGYVFAPYFWKNAPSSIIFYKAIFQNLPAIRLLIADLCFLEIFYQSGGEIPRHAFVSSLYDGVSRNSFLLQPSLLEPAR